jgi:hypothetical protein
MELAECYRKRLMRKARKDIGLVKSLLETSEAKIKTAEMLEINNITTSSVIVLVYDSLREILEAVALIHELKIYNHECFVPFIKHILNDAKLAAEFDKFRKIRNSINYYGKKVSEKEAEVLKADMINSRRLLIDRFLKRL